MADLKPLGSEKLQGMDKINRIMEIARYKETPKNLVNEVSTTNYTITLSDGKTYGIVKEKLGYIIKSGLNESTMDYVDHMKHRKHYRSYSEAMKKLNLMASEINRVTGYDENISLIGEQTDLKKKFVLKLPKPKAETPTEDTPPAPPAGDVGTPPAPPAPPAGDIGAPPAPPADDMGMGTPPEPPADDMGTPPAPPADDMGAPPADDMGTPPADDMGAPPADDMGLEDEGEDEGEEPQGPTGLKSIQKLTGRLSQKIRAFEKEKGMDSQDIKYVLNSIISALELENLDEDDKDDIISKFDESDEYGEEGAGELDLGDEDTGIEDNMDMGEETPPPPPSGPNMMESKVDKLLKSYFKISEDEKPILEEKKKKDFLKQKLQRLDVKKEFVKLSESLSQLKAANEFHKNNKNAKFIGKTNKENLVFVVEGKQYRITPRGRVI